MNGKKIIRKIGVVLWFIFILIIISLLINRILGISEQKKTELPVYRTDFIKGSENSVLSLELVPNYVGFFDGSSVKINTTNIVINSDGFRDYNYNIEKPNGTVRIMVLGDSYEFGWGVEMNESFPKILERMLNEKENKKYEVLNLGIPGYELYEKTEFFRYKGLKYNPNIIIIGLLGNDFGNNTEATRLIHDFYTRLTEDNRARLVKRTEQEIGIEADRLATIIIRKEEANQTMDEKWALIKWPLDDIYNLTSQNNITVILLNHVEQPLPGEIVSRLGEYIKDKNWFYFDCRNNTISDSDLDIPGDGHPNSKAHRIMAETIYKKMKELKVISS